LPGKLCFYPPLVPRGGLTDIGTLLRIHGGGAATVVLSDLEVELSESAVNDSSAASDSDSVSELESN
jgi:hypothetical protein